MWDTCCLRKVRADLYVVSKQVWVCTFWGKFVCINPHFPEYNTLFPFCLGYSLFRKDLLKKNVLKYYLFIYLLLIFLRISIVSEAMNMVGNFPFSSEGGEPAKSKLFQATEHKSREQVHCLQDKPMVHYCKPIYATCGLRKIERSEREELLCLRLSLSCFIWPLHHHFLNPEPHIPAFFATFPLYNRRITEYAHKRKYSCQSGLYTEYFHVQSHLVSGQDR